MRVLSIGYDPQLFVEQGASRPRQRAYADAIGELVILSRAPQTTSYTDGPLQVYGLRTTRLTAPFILARTARKLIREKKIDVVTAQDPFEHGLAAYWATRHTSAALHLQVHTDYLSPWFTRGAIFRSPRVHMPLLNGLRIRIADYLMPKADGIRVVSERIKTAMLARYGSRILPPAVIPIPVPTQVPPKVELPPRPFTFTLMAVSRLTPEKRVEDLLAVIRRLKDGYPSLGLVIVGDGPERRRLVRLAGAWGIQERVLFLGWRSDAWGLMQSANALIQASAYEGYGLTLLEAALAGVPILTSDVGIVGEVFVGYKHVLAAPVGDPTNLAALTAQLIEDTQARTLMAMEGKQAALAHLATVKSSPVAIAEDLARAHATSLQRP